MRKAVILALLLGGCVHAPIISASNPCSTLLPPDWEKGVAGAPLPGSNTVGDLLVFSDAQTGQLEKANDRYKAATGIIRRCEERDAAALKAARKRF